MVAASFVTQRNASRGGRTERRAGAPAARRLGLLFALGAAIGYGTSPLMAREAFLAAPGSTKRRALHRLCLGDPRFRVDPPEARRLERHQGHEP